MCAHGLPGDVLNRASSSLFFSALSLSYMSRSVEMLNTSDPFQRRASLQILSKHPSHLVKHLEQLCEELVSFWAEFHGAVWWDVDPRTQEAFPQGEVIAISKLSKHCPSRLQSPTLNKQCVQEQES